MKANQTIRMTAEFSGIKLWEIAKHMKIPEASFIRKLRYELEEEESQKILEAITALRNERIRVLNNE